jgi:hypothetical protein
MPPPTESAHPRTQIRSDRVLNRPGLLSAPIHTAGYPHWPKGKKGVRGETRWKYSLQTGVVYPDQYFFGASRIRIRPYLNGSGSFHCQAKKVRKLLIFTVLWLLYHFLSLIIDVNVLPSKSNKQKTREKKLFFVDILKATDEKEQDPDP